MAGLNFPPLSHVSALAQFAGQLAAGAYLSYATFIVVKGGFDVDKLSAREKNAFIVATISTAIFCFFNGPATTVKGFVLGILAVPLATFPNTRNVNELAYWGAWSVVALLVAATISINSPARLV
jgi:hypothetical protein